MKLLISDLLRWLLIGLLLFGEVGTVLASTIILLFPDR